MQPTQKAAQAISPIMRFQKNVDESRTQNLNTVKYFASMLTILFVLPAIVLAAPFTFVTLGDTQDVSDKGQERLNGLIESVNQRQPAFVVYIGS
jgi:hypothetical protein